MLELVEEFRMADALYDLSYSSGLDSEAFRELVLAATGDEGRAAREAGERAMARLRRGQRA
jgi:hypothetical protein